MSGGRSGLTRRQGSHEAEAIPLPSRCHPHSLASLVPKSIAPTLTTAPSIDNCASTIRSVIHDSLRLRLFLLPLTWILAHYNCTTIHHLPGHRASSPLSLGLSFPKIWLPFTSFWFVIVNFGSALYL
jgi:hypothetical protein